MKLILVLLLFLTIGCSNDNATKLVEYQDRIDSLERVIVDKDSDIEILIQEIEERESEISYLGHSLDSLKYNTNYKSN